NRSLCYSRAARPTASYTLSLHDALPILRSRRRSGLRRAASFDGDLPRGQEAGGDPRGVQPCDERRREHDQQRLREEGGGHVELKDRKSTRLNSSHVKISYAVFCLKKKNK